MIEVILKSKISGLGAEADVVKVRPGYARNYLLPRGFALPATAAYKHQIEQLKKARAEREANELNEANELAKQLNKVTLTFQMTAAEGQGKVFGSVTSQDILERLNKENITLEKKQLRLDHPLKEKGSHTLEVVLHSEVKAAFKVVLEVPKGSDDEADTAAKSRSGSTKKSASRKKKSESEKSEE
ncbi:MAG: 50S ribosomal protein L9 [Verrucomicrobiia bacterium]